LKKAAVLCAISLLFLVVAGCADFDTPGPGKILRNPIGTNSVKIGMTKSQVMDILGDPNFTGEVYSDKWGGQREEWFYKARLNVLPVNAGYLAEDLFLYFDEDSLTHISNTSLGRKK